MTIQQHAEPIAGLSWFIVLYRDSALLPLDAPWAFRCQATDADHAEEQCVNANTPCTVVWVAATHNTEVAYALWFAAADPST